MFCLKVCLRQLISYISALMKKQGNLGFMNCVKEIAINIVQNA